MFTEKQLEKIEYFKACNEQEIYQRIWMSWRYTPTAKKSAVVCWRRKNQSKYEHSENRLFTDNDGDLFEEKYRSAANLIGCNAA